MALRTLVKVNQVSSLSDARYCAGMGVDILGFTMDQASESFINPEKFEEITQWVSGPKFAGEFGTASLEEIKVATIDYKFDLIETSISNHLEALAELGIPIIYRADVRERQVLHQLKELLSYGQDLLSYLHLDLEKEQLEEVKNEFSHTSTPLIINVPSTLSNLDYLDSHGISLTAHLETKTGLQDYGEIMDVLEALELDD